MHYRPISNSDSDVKRRLVRGSIINTLSVTHMATLVIKCISSTGCLTQRCSIHISLWSTPSLYVDYLTLSAGPARSEWTNLARETSPVGMPTSLVAGEETTQSTIIFTANLTTQDFLTLQKKTSEWPCKKLKKKKKAFKLWCNQDITRSRVYLF